MLHFPLWKKLFILGLVLLGTLFAVPNLLPQETRERIPDWLPRDAVNLGLDLRGGAHLLVEVQVGEVVAARMESLRGDVRNALVEADVRRFTGLRAADDNVSVRISNPEDMTRAAEALRGLAQPVGGLFGGGVGGGSDLTVTETDDQTFHLTLSEAARQQIRDRTMTQSLEIVRRRIDESGTREPTIQRQGDDRILIQVPGVGSAEELLGLIGRTAKLTFHDVKAFGQEATNAGPGEMIVPDADTGEPLLVERRAILSGENLVDAQLGFHPDTGLPVVNFRFDGAGARIFGNHTAANVGRLFAVVLDDEVITAPRIQSPILGGSGFIEGNFTVESATELAVLLRSGALPASIKVLEQRTVGPDLGADSIEAGTVASIVSAIAVLAFMAISYRVFGLFANIALIVNIVLMFGLLSAIGATLTLPGIAGIVLTIGMAVDANVLIFERIREELRRNKSITYAIEKGYREAFSAIMDANITTLIAAVILFAVGSGPVKGFAVTLMIGLVTSVFTAVTFTRMMTAMWLQRARPKTLIVERIKYIPDVTNLRLMRYRRPLLIASVAAIIGSAALVPTMGLNYGIDFRGGTMIELRTPEAADLGQIRKTVNGLNLGEVQVQTFGSPEDVLLRVQAQGDGDEQAGIAETVGAAVEQAVPGAEVRRVEVVGPKVSGELLEAGVLAVLLSFVAILVYVWLRFEWQFGIAAVATLVHDVALTIGIFALAGIEFNLSIIAALLTIVGYSLNDTVVVFDRVRENLRKYKKMDLAELIDLSINETLARTLMTSVTTLIALVGLYSLGPEVISGFTFAMIWGVLVGTYSTNFIATPLLIYMGVKRDWSATDESKAGVQFGKVEG